MLTSGLAIGGKRGRKTPLLIADSIKQQRLVPASGSRGSMAAITKLGRGSPQESHEQQYTTLAQSLADGPVLKSLVVRALHVIVQLY